jgi:hypothetical protein
MSIAEKYKNLSAEQREKFNALKDSAGLDIFLSETGMDMNPDEKAQVLQYIESGKLPLTDEELENVAGGGCFGGDTKQQSWKKIAEFEGRLLPVKYLVNVIFKCGCCGEKDSMYARSMDAEGIGSTLLIYYDCKCYNSGKSWPLLNLNTRIQW